MCHARVERNAPDFPFCSERCRLLDLGNWISGGYRIPVRDQEAPDSKAGDGRDDEGEEN
jgi:uncharacterized protein